MKVSDKTLGRDIYYRQLYRWYFTMLTILDSKLLSKSRSSLFQSRKLQEFSFHRFWWSLNETLFNSSPQQVRIGQSPNH